MAYPTTIRTPWRHRRGWRAGTAAAVVKSKATTGTCRSRSMLSAVVAVFELKLATSCRFVIGSAADLMSFASTDTVRPGGGVPERDHERAPVVDERVVKASS